jgi:hypothetical protein
VLARLAGPRGELTLVVSGIPAPDTPATVDVAALLDASRAAGLTPRTTIELLRAAGMPRRAAYHAVQSATEGPSSDAG